MKRALGLSIVGMILLGLSASHLVWAHDNDGEEGVTLCHVRTSTILGNGFQLVIGHSMTVDEDDVQDHLNHGDFKFNPDGGNVRVTRRGCCITFLDSNGDPQPRPRPRRD